MPIRYGIFQLGQIWSVVGDNGVTLGFPTREAALVAGETMVATHRQFGDFAELIVQDPAGRLLRVDELDPANASVPRHLNWDPFS